MKGRVTRIPLDKATGKRRGFCFVQGDDGNEYFLHATGLQRTTKTFAEVVEGDQVDFNSVDGDKGLRAIEARVL